MKRWLLKLRGALSLGILGALAGATVGGGWELLSALLGGGLPGLEILVYWMSVGAAVGGASGLGFSALLSSIGRNPTIQDMSVRTSGLLGGTAGALASYLVAAVQMGVQLPTVEGALPFMIFCTGIGAVLGGEALRVAQVAAAREFRASDDHQDLLSDGGDP